MLADMLGFGGRIGRLRYFFLSLALAAVMTAAVLMIVVATFAPAKGQADHAVPWSVLLLVPPFLWATFALQAKRLRDIGWPPLLVIPAWLAIDLLDALVAHLVPALARAHGGSTYLGVVVNLLMAAALLFWPGNGESDFTPVSFGSSWRPPEPASPPPARRAEPAMPAPAGFGRRGL